MVQLLSLIMSLVLFLLVATEMAVMYQITQNYIEGHVNQWVGPFNIMTNSDDNMMKVYKRMCVINQLIKHENCV